MVERILRALFYHYIKQKAKLTLRKHDNSLHTTSSQNPLTTEYPDTTIATSLIGTSEKITMKVETEDIVSHIREWSLDRAANKNVLEDDARAILAEFYEWIEPEDEDIDIISLETDS